MYFVSTCLVALLFELKRSWHRQSLSLHLSLAYSKVTYGWRNWQLSLNKCGIWASHCPLPTAHAPQPSPLTGDIKSHGYRRSLPLTSIDVCFKHFPLSIQSRVCNENSSVVYHPIYPSTYPSTIICTSVISYLSCKRTKVKSPSLKLSKKLGIRIWNITWLSRIVKKLV